MSNKLIEYEAAGGVVLDANDRVLLIERTVDGQHEVRLPKGHIDQGEAAAAAARREVCEETGYCDLNILADLGWQTTEFVYQQKQVRRDERYYLMRLASERVRPPRFSSKREALFRNLWAAGLDEAETLLTFEAEKEVTRKARAVLARVT
ncbi:MAG: NUDIX domain-containing protein [Caldilineales bacterium]